MRNAKTFLSLALLALVGAMVGGVARPLGAADQDADRKAIRDAADAFTRAFNEGDAKAVAALFTEDADVIVENGEPVRGRTAIGEHFASALAANPGGKIELITDSLRFPTADTALEEGHAIVRSEGEAPETSRYTVLHIKRDGKWLQANVREHPEKNVSPHERLQELAWMVGEWVDENEAAVVFTTCRWSDDQNFLLRDFKIQVRGRPALSGSQRIGWDPLTRQIKSWVFDSEGGHGEGSWSRDGNQWIVKATGVLQDGRLASATQVITRVSNDQARWKSTNRTLGGRTLPDVDEIVVVRKPPKPL